MRSSFTRLVCVALACLPMTTLTVGCSSETTTTPPAPAPAVDDADHDHPPGEEHMDDEATP